MHKERDIGPKIIAATVICIEKKRILNSNCPEISPVYDRVGESAA